MRQKYLCKLRKNPNKCLKNPSQKKVKFLKMISIKKSMTEE
uniref:Uncharacterized protein n=1 Tax=viral metagenome TaxID=1070528 RepID=A0A6C0H6G1_9ZZZZ